MKFHKLRFKNLLSFGNIFTEIDLSKNKTTLIIGSNGAGKSTIIEAISFGLFNRAYRSVNKPQLINQITGKELLVEIEFEVNKKRYKVVRGAKPNIFEIYENGELIPPPSDSRDYQELLEKHILKTNHKTFCQVVILGTASFIPFMELPANSRREVVEDILDLKIFSVMNSLLKDKFQGVEADLKEIQNDKNMIEQKIALVLKHKEQMKETNDKIITEKRTRIKSHAAQVQRLKEQALELDKQIAAHGLVNYADLESDKANLDNDIYRIKNEIRILEKDIAFFTKHLTCPTCTQDIHPEFRLKTIDEKKDELKQHEVHLSASIDQKSDVEAELQKCKETERERDKLKLNRKSLENEAKLLIRSIKELQAECEILNKDAEKNVKDDLDELNDHLRQCGLRHKELSDQKQVMCFASVMLKDSGIKAKIIKQYVPVINKLINKYLATLDFFCDFTIDENFEEKILSRGRDNFSFHSFSEGEKFRINLAILFTWRAIARLRNSVNSNILFLDEVFDSSLDAIGIEEFLKLLGNLTEDNNVFIISHKVDQLIDKFETVIGIEKHKNFSRIKNKNEKKEA